MTGVLLFWAKAIGAFVSFLGASIATMRSAVQLKRDLEAEGIRWPEAWKHVDRIRKQITMKRTAIIAVLLVVAMGLGLSANDDLKGTLAVAPFQNLTQHKIEGTKEVATADGSRSTIKIEQLGWMAGEKVREIFARSRAVRGSYNLVDQQRLEMHLQGAELCRAGVFGDDCAIELGTALEATGLIHGTIRSASISPVQHANIGQSKLRSKTATVEIIVEHIDLATTKVVGSSRAFEGESTTWSRRPDEELKNDNDLLREALEKALKKIEKDEDFISDLLGS